ncbi:hyaluronate lyase N-terminal domain-containing protein [Methylobacterium sp. CM6257]
MSVRTQWLRDAWSFLATFVGKPGEFVVDTTKRRLVVHDGTRPGGHPTVSAGDLKAGVPVLGINTAADTTNRLAMKSEAALLSWDDVTPGAGNMRLTLDKGCGQRRRLPPSDRLREPGPVRHAGQRRPDPEDEHGRCRLPDGPDGRGRNGLCRPVGGDRTECAAARSGFQRTADRPVRSLRGDATGNRGPLASCSARAAPGAPLPIRAADQLFGRFGAGYHAGGAYTADAVVLLGVAEEDLTPTAQGTCLDLQTTAPSTAARRS